MSVLTSYVACYLTFFRSPYYALAYATNDLVLVGLWVFATLKDLSFVPMIVCFVVFFINDVYGFFSWRRIERRQRSEDEGAEEGN